MILKLLHIGAERYQVNIKVKVELMIRISIALTQSISYETKFQSQVFLNCKHLVTCYSLSTKNLATLR